MRADDAIRTFQTLRKTRKELERRVQERTAELAKANEALQAEITAHRRDEEELRFLLTITQGIAEAEDFHAALRVALRKVCEASGWDYGEAWIPRRDASALECSPAWYRSAKGLDRFRTRSEGYTFAPGIGLPGRVWVSKQPQWVQDISILAEDQYPRCKLAKNAGLKAALGVPIIADDEVLAVLGFFMLESRAENKRQVDLALAVATQLGSTMQHKRAEAALRESEALLQAIIDSSTRVIFLKDIQGRYLLVNRQYEELFHVTREQLKGRTDHDLFPRETADAFRENDLKVLAAGTPLEFEETVVQDDGIHTYIANKFPICDSAGVPYAVCGIAMDITERNRMEEELRQARAELEIRVQERTAELAKANEALRTEVLERRRTEGALRRTEAELRRVMGSVSDYLWSAEVDRTGRLTYRYYSPVVEKITGRPPEFYMRGPERWLSTVYPEDLPQIEKAYIRLTTGQSDHEEGEYRIIRPDGTIRWVRDSANARRSADGTIRLDGVVSDISERKAAETWLHRLIETTQDAVVSIDRYGRVVLYNPAAEQIFGYTEAEVRGQKVNLLMAEPYMTEHDSYIARYEQTGERRAIGSIRTVSGRRKNGEIFPMELSVTEVAAGESVRYAAFIRDISEKIKLQEQVMESERLAAIGSTAAMFAHEVGNPLNGMSMTIQLLERRLARRGDQIDETVTAAIKRLKDEITRLIHLLQDFSSLSRREQYSFRPISLATVAEEVCALEKESFSARGIQVEQDLPPDLPAVVADRHKLKQALLNLCKNALEAMPDGGKLTVRAYNSGERLNLEITDTGTGIPSGVDIFRPFVTTKTSGTGLGLIIVRQIISAHGGMISYSSDPGNGTTFRLSLPLSPPSTTVP